MKKKILIINANYYKEISKGLLNSALSQIPKDNNIHIINVPGVFEIPVTISKNLKKFNGFIALGCVLRVKLPILILFLQQQLTRLCNYPLTQKNQLAMEL